MPTVEIAALAGARKLVGFSRRTVAVEEGTVADLLRALPTVAGDNLYSHLVCDGQLRGDYAIVVNGLSLRADQLETPLEGGERVVMMAIVRHLAGG